MRRRIRQREERTALAGVANRDVIFFIRMSPFVSVIEKIYGFPYKTEIL
jgi:hypothetical protein